MNAAGSRKLTNHASNALASRSGGTIEPETCRVADANNDLCLVYRGKRLLGQARRSLDGRWHPELPAHVTKTAAIQAVIIADEAITQFEESFGGNS